MASNNPIHNAASAAGEKKDTSPSNPSIISSEGAIGKQFNPDGNIGQIGKKAASLTTSLLTDKNTGEKIGGPLSKDGVIGSQFNASKGGIAGTVEKAVDGPRNPAKK